MKRYVEKRPIETPTSQYGLVWQVSGGHKRQVFFTESKKGHDDYYYLTLANGEELHVKGNQVIRWPEGGDK